MAFIQWINEDQAEGEVGSLYEGQCLDACRQVTGSAGGYQVEGARNFATLNIGGSGTTSVSFVVGV